jgi:hypothetical protein
MDEGGPMVMARGTVLFMCHTAPSGAQPSPFSALASSSGKPQA